MTALTRSVRVLRLARRGRAPLGVLFAAAVLGVTACGGGAGGGARSASPAPAAPTAFVTPASYPGWPGSGPVGDAEIVPILVSQDLAVGENRFLLALADPKDNKPLAAPDLAVRLRFYDVEADPEKPVSEALGRFQWLVENEAGVYVASAQFTRPGPWGVEVMASKSGQKGRSARVLFDVQPKSRTPAIGARPPASETPTATDAASARAISTDTDADLDFYRMSVRDAVASGKPSVIVFATPAFCTSRTCGPALDIVKEVAVPFKGRVNFVHVEPYRLRQSDGGLQPELDATGNFQTVPAVEEWGLPTEPYIFVVDADGTVTAKFEGVAGAKELQEAIARVAG